MKCDNEIIFYDNEKTYTDIYQSCLIKLLLMSKTKVIIGSQYSNFPEFGWWLSNCKNKLIII